MKTTKKTLRGPGGIRVELDKNRVVKDDPGADTPAMVYLGKCSATYWCASSEGELLGHLTGYETLTEAQKEWLDKIEDEVNYFLYGG